MGNNSSQTKKKKRSSKIHPNFLIIKQEKIKQLKFKGKTKPCKKINESILENLVPDFNFSTITKPSFFEYENYFQMLPKKINAFEENNFSQKSHQIMETSLSIFPRTQNIFKNSQKEIPKIINNRYIKNLDEPEDDICLPEIPQKTTKNLYEEKSFEKNIVSPKDNSPCNSSRKKSHVNLARKESAQTKKSKFSKYYQEIHSKKISTPPFESKTNLMDHNTMNFSQFLVDCESTKQSSISSPPVKLKENYEEQSLDHHFPLFQICFQDNLKEDSIQIVEEKEINIISSKNENDRKNITDPIPKEDDDEMPHPSIFKNEKVDQEYITEAFPLHLRAITSIVISPKNNFLITASEDRTIKIFDIIKNQEIESLPCPSSLSCLCISPDEKMFAYAGQDICLRVRIMENFKLHRIFRDKSKRVEKTDAPELEKKKPEHIQKASMQGITKNITKNKKKAINPNNERLNEDKPANEISLKKKTCTSINKKKDLQQNESQQIIFVHCLVFSPDSKKLAAGYRDYLIRIWEVEDTYNFFYLQGHIDVVLSIIFTPDNENLISAGKNGDIIIWDVKNKLLLTTITAHKSDIFSLTISKDGKILASGGRDKYLIIWNLEKKVKLKSYAENTDSKNSAQIKYVEESLNLSQFRKFEENKFWINSICFSSDGELIVHANGDKIKVRKFENDEIIQDFGGLTSINSLALLNDSEIYSGHNDGNLRIWRKKQHIIENIEEEQENNINNEEITIKKETINEGKENNINEEITIQKEKVFLSERLGLEKEQTKNKNQIIDNEEKKNEIKIFEDSIHNATTLIYTSSHYEKFLDHIVLHPNDQEQYLDNLFNSDCPILLKLKMLLNILTFLTAQKHDRITFCSITSKILLYLRKESFKENQVYEKFLIHFIPLIVSISKLKNVPEQEIAFLFMIMDTSISSQAQSQILNYNKFLSNQQIDLMEKELFTHYEEKISFELKKMEGKEEEEFFLLKKYLNQLKNCFKPENFKVIIDCIKFGKFDKRKFLNHLDHSIIIGDDGGLYVLLNSVNDEEMSYLNKDVYMEDEYLNVVSEKKMKKNKNDLEEKNKQASQNEKNVLFSINLKSENKNHEMTEKKSNKKIQSTEKNISSMTFAKSSLTHEKRTNLQTNSSKKDQKANFNVTNDKINSKNITKSEETDLNEFSESEQEFQKILIGKGTFGKVRISLVLISCEKSDISMQKGEIICVKKSKDPDSTWNDYICIDSLDSAEVYDMKIIKKMNADNLNENIPKGYCFQKLLPYLNGDAFLKKDKICISDSDLKKWSHKRQYFLNLFRIIINLHNQGFCMTDLKPANTLYNKKTKITKLIDLAGIIRKNNFEKLKKCKVDEIIDNLEFTYKYSAPEICEMEDYEGCEIDLTKAIAYTFGKMMKEIILDNETEKFKYEKEIYDLYEKLTNITPESRLTLEEGLNIFEEIDPKGKNIHKKYGKYIKALKKLAFSEPFKLGLKNNILKIIKTLNPNVKLADNDPEIFLNEPKTNRKAFKHIDEFLKRKSDGCEEILFLIGPAGSGKSTIIQKAYLNFLKNWKKAGDAIPIYMNLCQETNIIKKWNQINDVLEYKNKIGFNFVQGEEEYPFVLFLDSFDESKEDFKILTNILNNLQRRNSNKKVILACRNEYFNYFKKNEIKRTSREIKYILPLDEEFFSKESFKNYLEGYFYGKTSDEIEEYVQKINGLNLREILKNNLNLSIVIDALPRLSKNSNDLFSIYNEYVKVKISSEQKKCAIYEFQIIEINFFIEKAIKLAQSMMKTKKKDNILEGEDTKQFLKMNFGDDYYKSSLPFFEQTKIYSVFRILDLNINVQSKPPKENIKLSFSHETIQDYFIIMDFFNNILESDSYPDWVSKILIVNNRSLINLMTEKVKYDNLVIEKFKKEINLTKYSNDEESITKAANLISILIASNVSFYGEDLSNVKIKGAKLNDGVFCKADLSHADLSSTNLNNTKFDGAILNKALFENANLDNHMRAFTKIHSDAIKSLALSPDEKYILSGGDDKLTVLWDFETGKLVKQFESDLKINSVAISKDNTKLAYAGSDMKIMIVDLKTRKTIKELKPKNISGNVNSLLFSPDTKSLAVSYSDSLIRIFLLDKKKGTPKILDDHHSEVLSMIFAPDGNNLICASKDKRIIIYNIPNSKIKKTLYDHNDEVLSVTFSADGKSFASCSKDATSIIWNVINSIILHKFEEENGYINCLVFSPDGKRLALGNFDSSIKIRDTQSGRIMQEIGGYNSVFSLVFTSNGERIISAGNDSIIRIWNVGFSKNIKKYEGHEGSVNTIALSNDGSIFASGGSDKKIIIWDALKHSLLKILEGHSEDVSSLSFSPNKSQLVSASYDRSIKIWDILSGVEIENLGELQNGYIKCLSYSADGQHIVSGNGASQIIIYDIDRKSSNVMGLHEDEVNTLAFSNDGSMLASGGEDCIIKLWNFKNFRNNINLTSKNDFDSMKENQNFLFDLKDHEGSILCLAFSLNERILASGSYDKCIILWNLEEHIKIKKINDGISSFIKTICFSGNEEYIIGGGGDKKIFYWNIENNKILHKLDGHSSYVNSMVITKDGKQIISGAADNTVRIWDIEKLESNCINEGLNIIYSKKILKNGSTRFSCKNCVGIEKCERMDQKIKEIFKENLNIK